MVLCNPTIYIGAAFDFTFTWKVNNEIVDRTGYQAKAKAKSSTASFEWSSGAGQIILGSDSTITMVLPSSFTSGLTPGSYTWDILIMDTLGKIYPPVVAGVITVLQGVTTWP